MTTARKPGTGAPTDNLMLIVGQLLEATKAASDGLKSMSQEVQSNAKAIIAASKTLEKVEGDLEQLDEIIRDSTNSGNLVAVTIGHTTQLATLHLAVIELRATIDGLKAQMGSLGSTQARMTTTKEVLVYIGVGVAWFVTTAIAVYAALQGK